MFKSTSSGLKWLWLSALIFVLDYCTKWFAITYLTLYEHVNVFPKFNLTLVYNHGAAFSMFNYADGWQRWFLSAIAMVVSIIIVVWLKQAKNTSTAYKLGLALILGGALGNLFDRLRFGYVIDFLDFYWANWHFPAFNLADSAITCGAVILLLTLWQKK